jgi:hypothetical protein
MIQVLSHFVDVGQALDVAAAITRPGGFWLIETWNPRSWSARVFGRHWHAYIPPSVLHWFSPAGLERFTSRFGFTRVADGKPAKWINGGHAKSLLRFHLARSWWGRRRHAWPTSSPTACQFGIRRRMCTGCCFKRVPVEKKTAKVRSTVSGEYSKHAARGLSNSERRLKIEFPKDGQRRLALHLPWTLLCCKG